MVASFKQATAVKSAMAVLIGSYYQGGGAAGHTQEVPSPHQTPAIRYFGPVSFSEISIDMTYYMAAVDVACRLICE